ncbi:selenobacteriocin [Dissulfurirhabdus thermomarina]|uniref:Selenobacteriocin n=1 Tax=Dissulfurirhabdus thermomarina TaxID=1765737 RepID=A0A6N9TKF1_DISTH|nr:selenobacteriocin [Dissulfurirhabdus thermomarina]NDY41742.1 selenobacteriocin [Dissulfurirhabdus thermomarina]NMX23678.1 selenobacteriocin [Dissulfurirhabdus thermomarina]
MDMGTLKKVLMGIGLAGLFASGGAALANPGTGSGCGSSCGSKSKTASQRTGCGASSCGGAKGATSCGGNMTHKKGMTSCGNMTHKGTSCGGMKKPGTSCGGSSCG